MNILDVIRFIFEAKKKARKTGLIVLLALFLFGLILYSMWLQGFSVNESLRDPAQWSGHSAFSGLLSNLGNFCWLAAVSISFFVYVQCVHKNNDTLGWACLFSLILFLDDFFLLHDRYVNQWICYAFYVITGLFLLIRHIDVILKTNPFAFLMSTGLMALSILTDTFQEKLPWDYLVSQILEEGFKFAGSVTWLYFMCILAASNLDHTISIAPNDTDEPFQSDK
ncbi:MAG: hypothetical protein ACKO5C_08880 [Ferruginibacter sp.]